MNHIVYARVYVSCQSKYYLSQDRRAAPILSFTGSSISKAIRHRLWVIWHLIIYFPVFIKKSVTMCVCIYIYKLITIFLIIFILFFCKLSIKKSNQILQLKKVINAFILYLWSFCFFLCIKHENSCRVV